MSTSALGQRIEDFLFEHPFGYPLSSLKKSITEYVKYCINYSELGYEDFESLVRNLEECWVESSTKLDPPLQDLVFPSSFEGICSSDTLFDRVWSTFQDAVRIKTSNGPVLFEEVWSLFSALIGHVKFCPEDWGFKSISQFVEYGNRLSHSSVVIVYRIHREGEDEHQQDTQYIFFGELWDFGDKFSKYRQQRKQKPLVLANNSAETQEVDGWDSQLYSMDALDDWIVDDIKIGDVIRCVHGLSLLPGMIGFVRSDESLMYSAFKKKMTQYYTSLSGTRIKKDGEFNLDHKNLTPGILVAVYYRSFWRRAVVTKTIRGKRTRVYIVDGASFINMKWNRIAALHKDFLEFPVQGILCRLDLGLLCIDDPNTRKFRHRVLSNLVQASYFKVKFLKKTSIIGVPFWTVEILSYDTVTKDGSVHSSFASDLNREVQNKALRKGGRKTKRIVSHNGGFGALHRRASARKKTNTKPNSEVSNKLSSKSSK